MKNVTWAYVAGFFDGEGCVLVNERKQQDTNYLRRVTRVRISQNDKTVLDDIQSFMNDEGIICHVEPHNAKKKAWNLQTRTARDTYLFLLALRDWVRVKYDKVEEAIAYLESLMDAAENGFMERRAAFVYRELAELRKVV